MIDEFYTLEARYMGEMGAVPLARTSTIEAASLLAAGLIGRQEDDPIDIRVFGPDWEIVLEYQRGGLSQP